MGKNKTLSPSKEELHGIKPLPTKSRPPKPNSQNTKSRLDEVVSIALWSIRRLQNQQYKDFAYDELEEVTGEAFERV